MSKKRVLIKLQSGSVTVAASRGIEWTVVDMNRKCDLPLVLPEGLGYEPLVEQLGLANQVWFHPSVRSNRWIRELALPLLAFVAIAVALSVLSTCTHQGQHPVPAATEIVYDAE